MDPKNVFYELEILPTRYVHPKNLFDRFGHGSFDQ